MAGGMVAEDRQGALQAGGGFFMPAEPLVGVTRVPMRQATLMTMDAPPGVGVPRRS
jgi:hypothetical protein